MKIHLFFFISQQPSGGVMGSGSGVTIVNVQCPLCARAFPKDKVELHASTCEGRSSSPLPEVVDIVDSTAQESPGLVTNSMLFC